MLVQVNVSPDVYRQSLETELMLLNVACMRTITVIGASSCLETEKIFAS